MAFDFVTLFHVEKGSNTGFAATEENPVTGASFFLFSRPLCAAGRLFGPAPATRDFDVLQIGGITHIHGLFFGGGSAFGLDAVGGLQAFQREQGIGVSTCGGPIPLCPACCIFDLLPLTPRGHKPKYPAVDYIVSSGDVLKACRFSFLSEKVHLPIKGIEEDSRETAIETDSLSSGFGAGAAAALAPSPVGGGAAADAASSAFNARSTTAGAKKIFISPAVIAHAAPAAERCPCCSIKRMRFVVGEKGELVSVSMDNRFCLKKEQPQQQEQQQQQQQQLQQQQEQHKQQQEQQPHQAGQPQKLQLQRDGQEEASVNRQADLSGISSISPMLSEIGVTRQQQAQQLLHLPSLQQQQQQHQQVQLAEQQHPQGQQLTPALQQQYVQYPSKQQIPETQQQPFPNTAMKQQLSAAPHQQTQRANLLEEQQQQVDPKQQQLPLTPLLQMQQQQQQAPGLGAVQLQQPSMTSSTVHQQLQPLLAATEQYQSGESVEQQKEHQIPEEAVVASHEELKTEEPIPTQARSKLRKRRRRSSGCYTTGETTPTTTTDRRIATRGSRRPSQAEKKESVGGIWMGRVGAGVGAWCGKIGFEGGFRPQRGGWGEACRMRRWTSCTSSNSSMEEPLRQRSSRRKLGPAYSNMWLHAFALVNAFGDVVDPQGHKVLAGPTKNGNPYSTAEILQVATPSSMSLCIERGSTTLIAIFTNLRLDRMALHRLCMMAAGGIARAIEPAFTPVDGDAIVAVSTEELEPYTEDVFAAEVVVGSLAAECVAQAIRQAVRASAATKD